MTGPEQRIVNACVRELDRRRILHFNLAAGNGTTGLPDRLAFPAGHVLPIEFKAPNGKLSARQKWMHRQFEQAGWPVLVVRDVQQLRAALDAMREEGAAT